MSSNKTSILHIVLCIQYPVHIDSSGLVIVSGGTEASEYVCRQECFGSEAQADVDNLSSLEIVLFRDSVEVGVDTEADEEQQSPQKSSVNEIRRRGSLCTLEEVAHDDEPGNEDAGCCRPINDVSEQRT